MGPVSKLQPVHHTARERVRAEVTSEIVDAARRLVVGVDESALLRWLIKNRQKAGIRKEYNDAARPSDTAPEPLPTPPPSRSQ